MLDIVDLNPISWHVTIPKYRVIKPLHLGFFPHIVSQNVSDKVVKMSKS